MGDLEEGSSRKTNTFWGKVRKYSNYEEDRERPLNEAVGSRLIVPSRHGARGRDNELEETTEARAARINGQGYGVKVNRRGSDIRGQCGAQSLTSR
jgi:hypothetical protein